MASSTGGEEKIAFLVPGEFLLPSLLLSPPSSPMLSPPPPPRPQRCSRGKLTGCARCSACLQLALALHLLWSGPPLPPLSPGRWGCVLLLTIYFLSFLGFFFLSPCTLVSPSTKPSLPPFFLLFFAFFNSNPLYIV